MSLISVISVDVMDVSDGYESGILDDIFKQRLDKNGQNITEAQPEKQGKSLFS